MGSYWLVCDKCKKRIPTFKWDTDKSFYNEGQIVKFLIKHNGHKLRHVTDRVAVDDPSDNYEIEDDTHDRANSR